jgi:hypothetical protein
MKDWQIKQDNIVIFNWKKQTSDKQKVAIENIEAIVSRWGKQLSLPLDTKMATM